MPGTRPATWREWLGVAVALGVLGAGLTLLSHEHGGWALVWRAVAAFGLGLIAAACWWAMSLLGGYGVRPLDHLSHLSDRDPPPAPPDPPS